MSLSRAWSRAALLVVLTLALVLKNNMGLERFDYYSTNKTHEDLKGAHARRRDHLDHFLRHRAPALRSEFRAWRALETVDKLDVDTTARPDGRLPVNIDIYLPSLPCAELITEVTDEVGFAAARGDRHAAEAARRPRRRANRSAGDGRVGPRIAPAFQQRKVVGLMEADAQQHLRETLDHLEHEREENPELSESEHEAHKAQLAQQAATLHGRLAQLTEVAQHADAEAGSWRRRISR